MVRASLSFSLVCVCVFVFARGSDAAALSPQTRPNIKRLVKDNVVELCEVVDRATLLNRSIRLVFSASVFPQVAISQDLNTTDVNFRFTVVTALRTIHSFVFKVSLS